MLNKKAFANSLALTTVVFYAVFYLMSLVAPAAFEFVFNAQFLGADIAGLMFDELSWGAFFGTLATVAVTAWVMGFVWATLYNRSAK